MQKFDLNSSLEEAEREMGGDSKGKWFKILEGANRVRILTPLISFSSHFKIGACLGKETCPICIENKSEPDETKRRNPSVKFLCHLIDYGQPIMEGKVIKTYTIPEGEIKLAQLPYGIAKSLQTLQNDPDYAFTEAPMPYDIKINAVGAGTKEVKYDVVASPKQIPVTPAVLEALAKLHTPEQVKESMQKKRRKELGLEVEQKSTAVEYPADEIRPEDIPF